MPARIYTHYVYLYLYSIMYIYTHIVTICCFRHAAAIPGHTLIRQGAWIEALGFYEAALNLLRSSGQDQEQQNCWLKCAFCHFNLEEYEAAIECLGPGTVGCKQQVERKQHTEGTNGYAEQIAHHPLH